MEGRGSGRRTWAHMNQSAKMVPFTRNHTPHRATRFWRYRTMNSAPPGASIRAVVSRHRGPSCAAPARPPRVSPRTFRRNPAARRGVSPETLSTRLMSSIRGAGLRVLLASLPFAGRDSGSRHAPGGPSSAGAGRSARSRGRRGLHSAAGLPASVDCGPSIRGAGLTAPVRPRVAPGPELRSIRGAGLNPRQSTAGPFHSRGAGLVPARRRRRMRPGPATACGRGSGRRGYARQVSLRPPLRREARAGNGGRGASPAGGCPSRRRGRCDWDRRGERHAGPGPAGAPPSVSPPLRVPPSNGRSAVGVPPANGLERRQGVPPCE